MEVGRFTGLMKEHFQLLVGEAERPEKCFRLVSEPYILEEPSCKYADFPMHTKGDNKTYVSPLVIKSALRKFEKSEEDFKEAYNAPPKLAILRRAE